MRVPETERSRHARSRPQYEGMVGLGAQRL